MPVGRSSSRASSVADGVRHDKLLSKILVRIVTELKNRGVEPTAQMMDEAKRSIESEWSNSGMTEKQIRGIATRVARGAGGDRRAKSSLEPLHASSSSKPPTPPAVEEMRSITPPVVAASHNANAQGGNNISSKTHASPSVDRMSDASEVKKLLRNTTRRERECLANAEWIKAMEEDRIAGIEGKVNDRKAQLNVMGKQRSTLDEQIEEHRQEAERERQRRQKAQDDMTAHIDNHRYLTRKEKQEAFDKAMKEKQFREAQSQEMERNREEQRTREHNEQVRHSMMVREELEQERQKELARKAKERREWEKTLQDNQARLQWKANQKNRERAEDREFQANYAARLDRIERERAEAAARKAARAKYFQKLADGVASQFMAKEQDLTDKIEAEYNAQLRAAMEDENKRKQRNADRTADCQSTIRRQMQEHEDEKKRQREEERRQAQALADQIAEAKHQEHCRKMASKQEAARLKKFLSSQLQMQHFKEAKPLETSIARPPSRSQSMYSPSRYTPSLRPESVVEQQEE